MFFRLIVRQARQKWGISCLLFFAMASLVVLYVYLRNSTQFTNRAMQIIMKNMGHNLVLLPEEANALDTYRCTDEQVLFSDEATRTLAKHRGLNSKYYVSTLQKLVPLGGTKLLLTGIEPVKSPGETREKRNPISPLGPGRARLGAEAARALGVKTEKEIAVLGSSFRVEEIVPERGTLDDYRVYIPLGDCQKLLGREGRINMILAFECLHGGGTLSDVEARQRRNLAKILPGFKQITKTDISRGRFMARLTTQRYLYYLLGLVLCITVVVIAITGLQEVSERRQEAGIMVAMGTSYLYIVGLYVVKILLVALLASAAGFLAGSGLSVWLTRPFLVFQTQPVSIVWGHLPKVMLLTCIVAVVAEIIPMIKLVRMDPSAILTEE